MAALTGSSEVGPDARVIRAPWTVPQVEALNHFQRTEFVHPYTCPMHDVAYPLVATRNGWICPHCAYTQDWASELMLETLADPREELAKFSPKDLLTPLAAVVNDGRYSDSLVGMVVRANWAAISDALSQTAAGVFAVTHDDMNRLVGAAHGGAMLFGKGTDACLEIEAILHEIAGRVGNVE